MSPHVLLFCPRRAVISAYFDEKGLVRQQLDSFNDFINTSLQVCSPGSMVYLGCRLLRLVWLRALLFTASLQRGCGWPASADLSVKLTPLYLPIALQEIVDEGKLITVKPQAQHVPGVAVDDDVEKTYEVRCSCCHVSLIVCLLLPSRR